MSQNENEKHVSCPECQKNKELLIAELVERSTDNPDIYKDWTAPQLQQMKIRLAQFARTQNTRSQTAQTSSGLTVGNSLLGKKQGEP